MPLLPGLSERRGRSVTFGASLQSGYDWQEKAPCIGSDIRGIMSDIVGLSMDAARPQQGKPEGVAAGLAAEGVNVPGGCASCLSRSAQRVEGSSPGVDRRVTISGLTFAWPLDATWGGSG